MNEYFIIFSINPFPPLGIITSIYFSIVNIENKDDYFITKKKRNHLFLTLYKPFPHIDKMPKFALKR